MPALRPKAFHQLMSSEAKSCVCKKQIHQDVFNFKPLILAKNLLSEYITYNNTSSSEKVVWSESGEKSAQIKRRL